MYSNKMLAVISPADFVFRYGKGTAAGNHGIHHRRIADDHYLWPSFI